MAVNRGGGIKLDLLDPLWLPCLRLLHLRAWWLGSKIAAILAFSFVRSVVGATLELEPIWHIMGKFILGHAE